MSNDNVVEFGKIQKAAKSDKAKTVKDRVVSCYENGEDCECMYCNYKKNAAEMVIDILARDMFTFENNNGAKLCTYDLKDIFFKAIVSVKKMENESNDEDAQE